MFDRYLILIVSSIQNVIHSSGLNPPYCRNFYGIFKADSIFGLKYRLITLRNTIFLALIKIYSKVLFAKL